MRVVAGPEAEADQLMRIRLGGDRVATPSPTGARRPEKRVRARSRLCQNRCTGLVLPENQPPNSRNTQSIQSSTRPKRAIASAIPATRARGPRRTVSSSGTPNGSLPDLDVDAELARAAAWRRAIEVRDRELRRASANDRVRPSAVRTTRAWSTKSIVISKVVFAVMQAAGGEPAHVDVQRSVPPVVSRRLSWPGESCRGSGSRGAACPWSHANRPDGAPEASPCQHLPAGSSCRSHPDTRLRR